MAATQLPRFPAPMAGDVAMAYPVSMDNMGPRSPEKLRDVLRQRGDATTYSSPPYRLTPEERLRLREQLRQQATWAGQPVR